MRTATVIDARPICDGRRGRRGGGAIPVEVPRAVGGSLAAGAVIGVQTSATQSRPDRLAGTVGFAAIGLGAMANSILARRRYEDYRNKNRRTLS